MFWSQATIPGRPRLLVVDGSRDARGWEAEFCDRLFTVLRRKGVGLAGDSPLCLSDPQDMDEALQEEADFNCILLFCHGSGAGVPAGSTLRGFWDWLSAREGLTPKLLAVCTCDSYDAETSGLILAAEDSFARFAIVPQSHMSPRAAGLFYIKLFSELDLHASDSVMGKMVWFSYAKARELLKRRQLAGQFAMRC